MILHILICSLIITGIYASTQNEMIFGKCAFKIKVKLSQLLNDKPDLAIFLINPLFGCVICMSSIWGSIYYFSTFDFAIIHYIKFIFAVAGLNTIIAYKVLND